MDNILYAFERPINEPVKTYAPGSKDRELLKAAVRKWETQEIEIPLIIDGKEVRTGDVGKVVMPHNHKKVIATYHKAGPKEVKAAIKVALECS